MIYRIITERINQEKIEKIVAAEFKCFTLITAQGFWKGKKEESLIIEINIEAFNNLAEHKLTKTAAKIKVVNNQENILLQAIESRSALL